ncbi:hypothetical protein K4L44_00740 [Halosquirtibacter laminarini]|uniref:Uncharacterized protein n=1 Tax=Halosquirtibacter laminarini TaxID=3374600 RepID=A0AC61NFM0_9BACT|nr:hypothetical protein K4L44_00740 [Prolixibacteraceae bacterium]
MNIIKILLPILILFSLIAKGQVSNGSGGHPINTKWKEINTEAVDVIYPEGIDSVANKIANNINYIYNNQYYSIGGVKRKLSLVLQTNQVQSNGYVSLAPYRSEFYLTPPQNLTMLGSMDWATTLSVHEYRHALQFSNLYHGFGKAARILMGDSGLNFFSGFIVPNWFFEGDAVMTETVLTNQGRGYVPSFFNEQKALLLNDKDYSYQKARNGSYKDLLPSHYPLGYAMVREAREVSLYKGDVWEKVLKSSMNLHGIIYPFSQSTKKHTGYSTHKLYKKAYADMKATWKKDLENKVISPSSFILKKEDRLVSMYNPMRSYDNRLFVLKKGYSTTPRIIEVVDGKEKKVYNVNNLSSDLFDINNKQLVWSQTDTDPVYQFRSYSNIYSLDLKTKRKTKLTSKTKLFSPSISPDGKSIVASEFDNSLRALVILDAKTGKIVKRYTPYHNGVVVYPKWMKDGESIVYIASFDNKTALVKQTLNPSNTKDEFTEITPTNNHVISNFCIDNNKIYFSASYSGTDNIYSTGLSGNKKITQISNVKVGAYNPVIVNNKLIYGDYTFKGEKLKSMDPSYVANANTKVTSLKEVALFEISKGKQEKYILSDIPNNQYDKSSYKGLFKGLKLHSWGSVNVNNKSGLGLKMDNILGDLSMAAVYSKHNISGTNQYLLNAVYGKYPVKISASASRQIAESPNFFPSQGKKIDSLFTPKVDRARLTLSLPIQTNSTNYSIGANMSTGIGTYKYDTRSFEGWGDTYKPSTKIIAAGNTLPSTFENDKITDETIKEINRLFPETKKSGIEYRASVSLSAIRNKAPMNLQPKFGASVKVDYTLEVNEKEKLSSPIKEGQWNVSTRLYLPGLMANDGIFIDGSYGKNDMDRLYQLKTTDFVDARGIDNIVTDERFSLRNNYQVPLWYPDFGIANIIYFKRMRLNGFYDLQFTKDMKIANKTSYNKYQSYGGELVFDISIINVLPMQVGIRYGMNQYGNEKRTDFFRYSTSFHF